MEVDIIISTISRGITQINRSSCLYSSVPCPPSPVHKWETRSYQYAMRCLSCNIRAMAYQRLRSTLNARSNRALVVWGICAIHVHMRFIIFSHQRGRGSSDHGTNHVQTNMVRMYKTNRLDIRFCSALSNQLQPSTIDVGSTTSLR